MQQLSSRTLRTAALSTLLLALVGLFVHFLLGFSYLPGADAYFYALQAQSILLEGHLKVPDHGAFCYVVAALARSGLSIEGAFRAALTIVFSVYQLGMFLLVRRMEKRSQTPAALLWALSSPFIAFHAIEFPNLTMGLATVPFWFWLETKPIQRPRASWPGLKPAFESSPLRGPEGSALPPKTVYSTAVALLLAAAALVHPAAAAIAALFAATLLMGAARDRQRRLRPPQMILAGCVGLLVVTALIYSGWKSRLLALSPGTPGLIGLMTTSEIPMELKLTVLFLWALLALFAFSYWRICSRKWRLMAVAVLLLPFWPDSSAGLMGTGGRLSALLVLIALPLLVVMGDELRETGKLSRWLDGAWSQRAVVLAVAIAVVVAPLSLRAYRQLLMGDDYAAYEQVVAALRPVQVPMLIAHRGLDFFYSYRLRRDAFHFDPEPNWNRAVIWRVAVRVTPEEVAYYSPTTCPWGETARLIPGTDYLLVREDCWEQLRARLNRNDNPDLYMEVWEDMENPAQSRPAFLRRRHGDSGGPFAAPKD